MRTAAARFAPWVLVASLPALALAAPAKERDRKEPSAAPAPPVAPAPVEAAPAPVEAPPAAPPVTETLVVTPAPEPEPVAQPAPVPVERWYLPRAGDPTAAVAPELEAPVFLNASLLVDQHGFLSTSFFRMGALGGLFSGTATEVRVRFGSPLIGVAAGGLFPGEDVEFSRPRGLRPFDSGLYVMGADFGRLAGVRLADFGHDLTLWLALPSVEARLLLRPDFSQAFAVVGSSVTGARLVWRDLVVDLRVARFDLWAGPVNSYFSLYGSVGCGLSVAWVL